MRLFISYRRQDSAAYAGRLSDDLANRYGPQSVFSDFAIPPGRDWRRHIEEALSLSDAVLVVIGPTWLEAAYRDGSQPRINDPNDLVRSELRAAFALQKLLVPVIVGGAQLPPASSLPEDIASLSYLEAVSLGHATWTRDVSRLMTRLDGKVGSRWTRWLPWRK